MSTYNGWKNKATWEAGVVISNTEPLYKAAMTCHSVGEIKEMFNYLEGDIDWNEIYSAVEDMRGRA